jgi:single-strand DNA-binding protein
MSINSYSCTGNLTRDPELRELPSGHTVCELRVAVDGMGRAGDPGFITVNVFGKPGEAAAEILAKGWLVGVNGRLEFRQWEPESGQKRTDYQVIGGVEFLAPPRSAGEQSTLALSHGEPVTA